MDIVGRALKVVWLPWLEPPWRHSGEGSELWYHWLMWCISWAMALAGLVFGAFAAPSVVNSAGFSASPVRDELIIAVAVVGGIVFQLLGTIAFMLVLLIGGIVLIWVALPIGLILWVIYELLSLVTDVDDFFEFFLDPLPGVVVYGGFGLAAILTAAGSLAIASYEVHNYLLTVGSDAGSLTVAFIGGLLIKTFAIPLIKGIATGALFKWFMNWLRGGKDKKSA